MLSFRRNVRFMADKSQKYRAMNFVLTFEVESAHTILELSDVPYTFRSCNRECNRWLYDAIVRSLLRNLRDYRATWRAG